MATDEFGIKVTLDTKDAQKGLKDLNKAADALNDKIEEPHKIGVDGKEAVSNIDKVGKSIDDIDRKLDGLNRKANIAFSFETIKIGIDMLKGLANGAKKVYDMVSDTAHEIVSLSNTAQGLSMSANGLKAWETTFQSMGLNAKDADAALGAIQDRLTGQLLNPSIQVASAFSQMGINLRASNGELKTSESIMMELADRFKKMKPEYALALGAQVGLSRDVITQMRTSKDFSKTLAEQKAKPVITKTEEQEARGFVKKQADFDSSIDLIKNKALMPMADIISTQVMPQLKAFAEELAKITGMIATPNNVQSAGQMIGRATQAGMHPWDTLKSGFQSAGSLVSNAWSRMNTPFSAKDSQQFYKNISNLPSDIIAKIQGMVETGGNSNQIGYAMTRDPSGKYQYKRDAQGNKIPEAYGKYQIKPSTASEVMGYNVTPDMLKNDDFNTQVNTKYMNQLIAKNGGDKAAALAAYNGDLARYKKTGSAPYLEKFQQAAMGSGLIPSASDSNTVNNNTRTNNQSVNVDNVHLHGVQSPQQFIDDLLGFHQQNDRANNMTGMQT